MKKKLLLKTMLLLCALVAGSGSVWATDDPDVTYNFGSFTSAATVTLKADNNNLTITLAKNDGSNNPAWNSSASEARVYAKGSLTVSSTSPSISKIVYTYVVNENKNGIAPTIDGVTGKTNSGTWNEETKTWTGDDKEVTFNTSGSAGNIGFTSIAIYYKIGNRTEVNLTDFAAENTTLLVGDTQATTVSNDQSGWTAAYTYSSDDEDVATISNTGVITAIGKGTTKVWAELNIAGTDANYKKGSTYKRSIDIIVYKPSHTAKFSINGVIDDNDNDVVEEDEDITFPDDPAAIGGYSFVGWATGTIDGTTATSPTFVTSATMGDADVTYYAVFAKVTGNEPAGWIETELADMTASDVFVFSNGTYAMNNDGGTSSAPSANSITVSEGKITSEVADKLKWNVSGNATDGYTFYPNGSTTTWLYCNTTASSKSNENIRVGTGSRKLWIFTSSGYLKTNDANTARYLSIYDESDFRSYVNTENGAFVPKFYKYTEGSITATDYCTTVVPGPSEPEINGNTITLTTTPNMAGWRSFYESTTQNYQVDSNTKIYIATTTSDENVVQLTPVAGNVIAGQQPVILKTSASTHEMVLTETDDAAADLTGNLLAVTNGTDNADGYRLGYKDGIGVAFFKYTATAPAAGIVYIDATNINTGSGAPEFLLIGSEATGVNDVRSKTEEVRGEYFNLNGQRVAQPTKGLYIVNGRKVIMK